MGNCSSSAIVAVSINSSIGFVILITAIIPWVIVFYDYFIGHWSRDHDMLPYVMAKVHPSATFAAVESSMRGGQSAVLKPGSSTWDSFFRHVPSSLGFSPVSNNGRYVVVSLSKYIKKYQTEAAVMLRSREGDEIDMIRDQEHFNWERDLAKAKMS